MILSERKAVDTLDSVKGWGEERQATKFDGLPEDGAAEPQMFAQRPSTNGAVFLCRSFIKNTSTSAFVFVSWILQLFHFLFLPCRRKHFKGIQFCYSIGFVQVAPHNSRTSSVLGYRRKE